MKTLLLLAVLGFVLSVGFALPFSEDEAQNDALKDIAGDFETENPNSDFGMDTKDEEFDDEDFDNDDNYQDEDPGAEEDEYTFVENYENDDDDDTAVKKLSDPMPFRIGRVFRRVSRGVKKGVSTVGRKVTSTVGAVTGAAKTVGRAFTKAGRIAKRFGKGGKRTRKSSRRGRG